MPYGAVYLLGMMENIDDRALRDNNPQLSDVVDRHPVFEKPSTKLIRSAEMSANAAPGITLVTARRSDRGQVRTHQATLHPRSHLMTGKHIEHDCYLPATCQPREGRQENVE